MEKERSEGATDYSEEYGEVDVGRLAEGNKMGGFATQDEG